MKIGFTGTQRGMTAFQKTTLPIFLKDYSDSEFHHGDCIGADAEAAAIADSMGYRIVVHPPLYEAKRAFARFDEIWEAAPYLVRNHEIVDAVDFMIATPAEIREQLRSGTWATIRYARKISKSVIIIPPN